MCCQQWRRGRKRSPSLALPPSGWTIPRAGCGPTGTPIHRWDAKCRSPSENSLAAPRNIKQSDHVTRGCTPRAIHRESPGHTKTVHNAHSSVFITAEKWEPPRCPLPEELINQTRLSHTLQCSGQGRGGAPMHATGGAERRWMHLSFSLWPLHTPKLRTPGLMPGPASPGRLTPEHSVFTGLPPTLRK